MPHNDDAAPRLPHVRPLHLADAPQVLQAFHSDPEMSRQGAVTTAEEAVEYVRRVSDPGSGVAWAVCGRSGLVGVVGITVNHPNRNGWFWYWMTAEARGRGWATRAAVTVADWALSEGGLERLELGHRVNNPASGAVARAAGFLKEGTERGKFLMRGERIDVDTYGRLRTDPWPEHDHLPIEH